MSTGTYKYIDGQITKVSDKVPHIQRPIHFNKGGTPEFDKSLRRSFNSRSEKRAFLAEKGLREGGIIDGKDSRLGE